MKKENVALIVGLGVAGAASLALASSGMPWERPLDTVAGSITGKAGASIATIGIAWSGVNWGRGTEHGKEVFLGTTIGSGLIFGAATMVNAMGGSAGGAPLFPPSALPMAVFIADAVGEAIGHVLYGTWLFAGLLWPFVSRKRA